MDIKLAAPLFILRNEAEQDLFAVLERLSALGFDGVEFLGFFGKTPSAIREKLDSLSMAALGNHINVDDFMKNPHQVLADHLELGCKYITVAWPDPSIKSGRSFNVILESLKYLIRKCCEAGITPLYHNHDYEFETEPSMVDNIMDICRKIGLCLEPDLGWMAFKRVDPASYLLKYADCCPVIHLKDFYAEDITKVGSSADLGTQKANPDKGKFEFRPVGYGNLGMAGLMPLCLKCKPEWLVMDHDLAYERDSFSDLKLSLAYTKHLLEISGV